MAHARRALTALALAVGLLGSATPALAAIEGHDVSRYQHPYGDAISWGQVAADGKEFIFIQATKGNADSNDYFAADWKAIRDAGMVRGAYHYGLPSLPLSNAVRDARFFVSRTGSSRETGTLPPVLDMENSGGLAPADLQAWTRTWLDTVEGLTGRKPIIYTYPYFWKTAMANTTAFTGYPLWLANYVSGEPTRPLPGGWDTYTFWQYSQSGRSPGIARANVDLNKFCCAESSLQAFADGTSGGTAAANPFGSFDALRRMPGGVFAGGWTIDPDSRSPIDVHVYLDGRLVTVATSDGPSDDVERVYPGFGATHRFGATVPVSTPGPHTVCTYAINTGPGDANPALGCRSITLATAPVGYLDDVRRAPGGVTVGGWTLDPDTTDAVPVTVTVDGRPVTTIAADTPRADVGQAFPAYGPDHGYSLTVPVAAGRHTVCVTAADLVSTGTPTSLGCRSVDLDGTPVGYLDTASAGSGSLRVAGWTLDPDTAGSIPVHVYVDGRFAGVTVASTSRPDVDGAFPGYGANHGYDLTVPATPGSHQVCVYAIDSGGGPNPLLGCRTT